MFYMIKLYIQLKYNFVTLYVILKFKFLSTKTSSRYLQTSMTLNQYCGIDHNFSKTFLNRSWYFSKIIVYMINFNGFLI